MSEVIERLLAVEKEARAILARAERDAEAAVEDARRRARELAAERVKEARREAEELLAAGRKDLEEKRRERTERERAGFPPAGRDGAEDLADAAALVVGAVARNQSPPAS